MPCLEKGGYSVLNPFSSFGSCALVVMAKFAYLGYYLSCSIIIFGLIFGQQTNSHKYTDKVCNLERFRNCYIELSNSTVALLSAENHNQQCGSVSGLLNCVEEQLYACAEELGSSRQSLVQSYLPVLKLVLDTACSYADDSGSCDLGHERLCLLDYGHVLTHGSLTQICSQAEATSLCMAGKDETCSGLHSNLVSMVFTQILVTKETVCKHESCSTVIAKQCLDDAMDVVNRPVTIATGSLTVCRQLSMSLTCAVDRTSNCSQDDMPRSLSDRFLYLYQLRQQYCTNWMAFVPLVEIPAGLESALFMSAVVDNAWAAPDDVCLMLDSAMSRTKTADLVPSSWLSVNLLFSIYGDYCRNHSKNFLPQCGTSVEKCNTTAPQFCGNETALNQKIVVAMTTNQWSSVCRNVDAFVNCVHRNISGCNSTVDRQPFTQAVWSVVSIVQSHCPAQDWIGLLDPCPPQLICEPHTALEKCRALVPQNVSFSGVCQYQTEIETCFKEYTRDCFAIQSEPVQFYLEWLLYQCQNQTSILVDDDSLRTTQCFLQMGYTLNNNLRNASDFFPAICNGLDVASLCLGQQELSPLEDVILSKYSAFYSEFYQRFCNSNSSTSERRPTNIQEAPGCAMDMIAMTSALHIQRLVTSPFLPVQEQYSVCLSTPSVIQEITQFSASCSPIRQNVSRNVIEYMSLLQNTYCSRGPAIGQIDGSCDANMVQFCLEEIGGYIATTSVYDETKLCRKLEDSIDCLLKHGRACADAVQEVIIQELKILHSILGNISCPNLHHCKEHMENASTSLEEREGNRNSSLQVDMRTSLHTMLCGQPAVCSFSWQQCLLEDFASTCSNATSVKQCIQSMISGCDSLQNSTITSLVYQYASYAMNALQAPCDIMPSQVGSPEPVYTQLLQCYYYNNKDNSKSDVCSAMYNQVMCMESVLYQNNSLASVWRGYFGRKITFLQKEYYLKCSMNYTVDNSSISRAEVPLVEGTCDTTLRDYCHQNLQYNVLGILGYPLSDKLSLCNGLEESYYCLLNYSSGCQGDSQRSALESAFWLMDVAKSEGVCYRNSPERECAPQEAMDCIVDLGQTLDHSKETFCSKIIPTVMCVSSKLRGCSGYIMQQVEGTLKEAVAMATEICSPVVPSSGSLDSCFPPGEATVCDLEEALVCMVPVQSKLLQYNGTWAEVCGLIPTMKSCINKHTARCDDYSKEMLSRRLYTLSMRVGDQCPQIYCEACLARDCLRELYSSAQFSPNICVDIALARRCIGERTMYCEQAVGEDLERELSSLVGPKALATCDAELPACFGRFRMSAFEIVNYDGSQMTMMMNMTSGPVYDTGLYDTCQEATEAYSCLAGHYARVSPDRAAVLNSTLQTIGNFLYDKCQGPSLQCHACYNASSNEECNAAPVISCFPEFQLMSLWIPDPTLTAAYVRKSLLVEVLTRSSLPYNPDGAKKMMCSTLLENNTISKGCVRPETCQSGCIGSQCTMCCHGNMCNEPEDYVIVAEQYSCQRQELKMKGVEFSALDINQTGTSQIKVIDWLPEERLTYLVDPPSCQVQTSMWCAFDLMLAVTQYEQVDCRFLQEAVNCIAGYTSSCVTDTSLMFSDFAQGIMSSGLLETCSVQDDSCLCGQCTSNLLMSLISSPYESLNNTCRLASSLYNRTLSEMGSPQCYYMNLQFVSQNLQVARNVITASCFWQDYGNHSRPVYLPMCDMDVAHACFQNASLPYLVSVVGQLGAQYVCLAASELITCVSRAVSGCSGPVRASVQSTLTWTLMSATHICNIDIQQVNTTFHQYGQSNGSVVLPKCDMSGIQYCVQQASLPYYVSMVRQVGAQYVCLMASELVMCVSHAVSRCSDSEKMYAQSSLTSSLMSARAICNIDLVEVEHTINNYDYETPLVIQVKCDLTVVQSCIQNASLPYLVSMVGQLGTQYICLTANELITCVSHAVAGCSGAEKMSARSTLTLSLMSVTQVCDIDMQEVNRTFNNTGDVDNTQPWQPCLLSNAQACFDKAFSQDICRSSPQRMVNCVQNFTQGCSSVQQVPVFYTLQQYLQTTTRQCSSVPTTNYTDPTSPVSNFTDPLYPVSVCTLTFAQTLTGHLRQDYLTTGDFSTLCVDLLAFRTCLYGVVLPPAGRMYVRHMESTMAGLSEICQHQYTDLPDPVVCHSCHGNSSSCDSAETEVCSFQQEMCHSTMVMNPYTGQVNVQKGCATLDWCQTWAGCYTDSGTCVQCCHGDKCNHGDDNMPRSTRPWWTTTTHRWSTHAPRTRTDAPRSRQTTDVPLGSTSQIVPNDCLPTNVSVSMVTHFLEMFNFYYSSATDRWQFCWKHAGLIQSIMTISDDKCSTLVAGNVQTFVHQLFSPVQEMCLHYNNGPQTNYTEPHHNTSVPEACLVALRCLEAVVNHIDSVSVLSKDSICMSINQSAHCIVSHVQYCPMAEQHTIHSLWDTLLHVNQTYCHTPPDNIYDRMVPECVDPQKPRNGSYCDPTMALQCVDRFNYEVGHPLISHERICRYIKQTVQCFVDHSYNCSASSASLIQPAIQDVMWRFGDQCPSVWCQEAHTCRLQGAHHCLAGLEDTLSVWQKGGVNLTNVCMMISNTRSCIFNTKQDCFRNETRELRMKFRNMISDIWPLCVQDSVDVRTCVDSFGSHVHELILLDRKYVKILQELHGLIQMGFHDAYDYLLNNISNSSYIFTKDGTNALINIKDNITNFYADDRSYMYDSMINHIGHMNFRYLLNMYIEEKMQMCNAIKEAGACVSQHLYQLPDNTQFVVQMTVHSLHQLSQGKCQALQCHTCNGLKDNESCNRQQVSICPPLQVCQTSIVAGHVTKGCKASWSCEKECQGHQYTCYCCDGQLCNSQLHRQGEKSCNLHDGLHCGLNLTLEVMNYGLQPHSLSFEHNIGCIMNSTAGCTTPEGKGFNQMGHNLKQLLHVRRCAAEYGEPVCGVPGVTALGNMLINPYISTEEVCRVFNSTLSSYLTLKGSYWCSETQLNSTRQSLLIAMYQLHGFCSVSHQDLQAVIGSNCTNHINSSVTQSRDWNVSKTACNSTSRISSNCTNQIPQQNRSAAMNCSKEESYWLKLLAHDCNLTHALECFNLTVSSDTCNWTQWQKLSGCVGNATKGCPSVEAAPVLFALHTRGRRLQAECRGLNHTHSLSEDMLEEDPFLSTTTDMIHIAVNLSDILVTFNNVQFGLCQLLNTSMRSFRARLQHLPTIVRVYEGRLIEILEETHKDMCHREGERKSSGDGHCPDNTTVRCLVDPCSVGDTLSLCPAFPKAICRPNYCGGCRGDYFFRDRNVTHVCNNTTESECSLTDISNHISYSFIQLMLLPFSPVRHREQQCRDLMMVDNIRNMTASCGAIYQTPFDDAVDWILSQTKQMCHVEKTSAMDQSHNPSCSISMITKCLAPIGSVISGLDVNNIQCMHLEHSLECLHEQASNCPSVEDPKFLDSLVYIQSAIQDRCPSLLWTIQCEGKYKGLFNKTARHTGYREGTTTASTTRNFTQPSNVNMSTATPPTRIVTSQPLRTRPPARTTTAAPMDNGFTTVLGTTSSPSGATDPPRAGPTRRPGRETTRQRPDWREGDGCDVVGVQMCIMKTRFPNMSHSFCSDMNVAMNRILDCTQSQRLEGCTKENMTSIQTFVQRFLTQPSQYCGTDYASLLFHLSETSQQCRNLPRCSFSEANTCIDRLRFSSQNCSNLPEVVQCTEEATSGCTDLQRYPIMYSLVHWARYNGLPEQCLEPVYSRINSRSSPVSGLVLCVEGFTNDFSVSVRYDNGGNEKFCHVFKRFVDCMRLELESGNIPTVVQGMYGRSMDKVFGALGNFCQKDEELHKPTDDELPNTTATVANSSMSQADVCKLSFETGPCRAVFPRWYYNSRLGKCEQFIYGGCDGNKNNFLTKESCDSFCGREDICKLSSEAGPCRAAFPRWYYNSRVGKCEQFIYGGCDGNENNFPTKDSCDSFCSREVVCQPFIEPNPSCMAYFPRFRHIASTDDCESFIYGGCGGNANNFETLEACREKCAGESVPEPQPQRQSSRKEFPVCDVDKAVMCLNFHMVHGMFGVAMATEGKHWLCDRLDDHSSPCLEDVLPHCSPDVSHVLTSFHQMTELVVRASGMCEPQPTICSVDGAARCLSDLGRTVAGYGITASRQDVCGAYTWTKTCIKENLLGCDWSVKSSIMQTVQPINCQALDICPMALPDENHMTTGSPSACVDPAKVHSGSTCEIQGALQCLQQFHSKVQDPYGKREDICRLYSESVHCFYNNLHNCSADLPLTLAHLIFFEETENISHMCDIHIKPLCDTDESHDCYLSQAETCIDKFLHNLSDMSEQSVCLSLKIVKICITESTRKCKPVVQNYVTSKLTYGIMHLDIECKRTVQQCTSSLVRLVQELVVMATKTLQPMNGTTEGNGTATQKSASVVRDWTHDITGSSLILPTQYQSGNKTGHSGNASDEVKLKHRLVCTAMAEAVSCSVSFYDDLSREVSVFMNKTTTNIRMFGQHFCEDKDNVSTRCGDDPERPVPCDHHCLMCNGLTLQKLQWVFDGILSLELDNATSLCSSLELIMESFKSNMSACSVSTDQWSLFDHISEDLTILHEDLCIVPPETCDLEEANLCIDDFRQNLSSSDTCSVYEAAKQCLLVTMDGCDTIVTDKQTQKLSDLFKSTNTSCKQFPKVKIAGSNLRVVEGGAPGHVNITMSEAWEDVCPVKEPCRMEVMTQIVGDDTLYPKCRNDRTITQLLVETGCSVVFDEKSWNQTKHLSVTARVDQKTDGATVAMVNVMAVWYTGSVDSSPPSVQTIGTVQVTVADKDSLARCSSVNDPHLRTFDGLNYDNFHQGEFVLYRHITLPFAVNIIYQPCGSDNSASCNCATMVQSGDDVFVLDACLRRGEKEHPLDFRVYQNGVITPGTRVYREGDGRKFQIVLPHGTIVKVQSYTALLDVWIIPSPYDVKQTEGLCGTYDGFVDNDLTGSDGTVYNLDLVPRWPGLFNTGDVPLPRNFSLSWRARASLFRGVEEDSSLQSGLSSYCECTEKLPGDPTCGESLLVEACDIVKGEDITEDLLQYRQSASGRSRRKRQAGSGLDDIVLDVTYEPQVPTIPTASGWNASSARMFCENAILSSAVGSACASVVSADGVINNCVVDILLSDSAEWLSTSQEAYRTDCRLTALRDSSIDGNTVAYILANTCTNNCSGNGICQDDGECGCYVGFLGADCSVSEADAPVVTALSSYEFVSDEVGQYVTDVDILGSGFIDTGSLTCHTEEVEIDESGNHTTTGTATTVNGTLLTFNRVQCSLTGTLPLTAMLVSVSLDGATQSNKLLYVGYNPICYTCDIPSGICEKVPGSCVLDGVCYAAGTVDPTRPCYLCDPISEQWQYKVSAACPPVTTSMMTSTTTTPATMTMTTTTVPTTRTTTVKPTTTTRTTTTMKPTATTKTTTVKTTTTLSPTGVGGGADELARDREEEKLAEENDRNMVIVLVVAGVAGVILIVVVVIFAVRQRRSMNQAPDPRHQQRDSSLEGNIASPQNVAERSSPSLEGGSNPTYVSNVDETVYDNAGAGRDTQEPDTPRGSSVSGPFGQATSRMIRFQPTSVEEGQGTPVYDNKAYHDQDDQYPADMDYFDEPDHRTNQPEHRTSQDVHPGHGDVVVEVQGLERPPGGADRPAGSTTDEPYDYTYSTVVNTPVSSHQTPAEGDSEDQVVAPGDEVPPDYPAVTEERLHRDDLEPSAMEFPAPPPDTATSEDDLHPHTSDHVTAEEEEGVVTSL